jgi:hypothetical protein
VNDISTRSGVKAGVRTYKERATNRRVQAVRLTEENGHLLIEWVEPSKPFYDPGHVITGLTVFTAYGRIKANWGDWIVRLSAGRFVVNSDVVFGVGYEPAEQGDLLGLLDPTA